MLCVTLFGDFLCLVFTTSKVVTYIVEIEKQCKIETETGKHQLYASVQCQTLNSAFSVEFVLSSSISPSLFHSRLKTFLFHKFFHYRLPSGFRTEFTDYHTVPFLLIYVRFSFLIYFPFLADCSRLS